MDVLRAWFHAPRGEGIGGQARLEPIGERLRGGERVEIGLGVGEGHDGYFEKATRVFWERKKREFEGFGSSKKA